MTSVLLENISLAFGEKPLLNQVHLNIKSNERMFLIGRNGAGKSSLLKIISGALLPDEGKVHRSQGLKIAELSQILPEENDALVYDVVASGLQEIGDLLKRYHELTQAEEKDAAWFKAFETVQQALDNTGAWHYQNNIDTIITRLALPENKRMNELSGGWKRRVALARALVSEPDLLLLDEPTNHLDLEAIEWLETFLQSYTGSVLCITHDRSLLKKLSKTILELDRGNLTLWPGNYEKYLSEREHRLEVESTHFKLFDKKLAQEETWIRQGIKARRTRNEGRVRALIKLRQERQERRELQKKPNFTSNIAEASGKLVVQAEHIHFRIDHLNLVDDFSITVQQGDKLALIGPNGVGKSTLLKLLLGDIQPSSGKLQLGTKLQIGYFDQLRTGIRLDASACENVAGGRETIVVNGKEKHVMSYLADFLFTPEKARTPIKFLSGGECNRLLLAKLFSLPTNLLVLDEPTNDLDIETLELLEELLMNYSGTVLLVSHDRSFIDNVVTSVLYFSGNGKITEFVGGYSNIPEHILHPSEPILSQKSVEIKPHTQKIPRQKKSSHELTKITEKIAELEKKQEQLHAEMATPEFYTQDKPYIDKVTKKLALLEDEIEKTYQRWEELDK